MDEEISRSNITCPFCGLACDDLTIKISGRELQVAANGCAISTAAFAQANLTVNGECQPRVDGKPVDLKHAILAAANVLRDASQALFSGLMTDVSGMRAIMQLADRCGAILDHPNSPAFTRNLAVLQDSGWITTTLSEVKNRVDLLVFIGTDAVSRFPRFFERIVWNEARLFDENRKRQIVYLGQIDNTAPGIAPNGDQPGVIPCDQGRLGEVVAILRCLASGQALQASEIAGISLQTLKQLLATMRNAKYGVICWAASDLDFPHAELTIQSLCELVKELNKTTRFSGLPLGGSDSDITANQVCSWQTGFSLPISLSGGRPDYNPRRHSMTRVLERSEADALLWVSSYQPQRTPPETHIPTVILGHPGMKFKTDPKVYIPVATPGIDHAGHIFRSDMVVALPLRKLRNTELLTVADAIHAIENLL